MVSSRRGEDAGFVEDVDDFAGETLEFVVEVVGEEVDALVGALDAAADLGEVFGLLVAQLVEFRAELAEEFLEFLFERGAAFEVVDDLEEDEEDGGERGGVDEPGGEAHGIGRGDFLGEERHEHEGEGVTVEKNHGWVSLGGASGGGAGGVAKDLTALGGKVGSAGAGVESEEGGGVEIGGDGAKLVTFGVGKVDKDAVLQAGKAEIDRLKAASEEIVFEVLDIIGGLGGGGVEAPGLGLVKEVVDEMDELAAGFGNFGDHGFVEVFS
jgi:hypothetical protein